MEGLGTADRIRRAKASFFPFLLLRDLGVIGVFSASDRGPSSDCVFVLRSNWDFAVRKMRSIEGVTLSVSKASLSGIAHEAVWPLTAHGSG